MTNSRCHETWPQGRIPVSPHSLVRPAAWRPALLILAVMAAVVSGANSWVPGPWLDEGATILSAQRSWGSLATMVQNIDAVHGFYYATMHVWFDLVGYSPLTLRLPSVIATSVAAVLIAILGSRLLDPKAGLLAGVAYALMPSTALYATEGRSSALVTALVTLTVLLFVEAYSRRSFGWWLAYAAAAAMAAYVFLLGALAFVVFPVVMLTKPANRSKWVGFTIGTLVAALACVPLLGLVLRQRGQVSWINEPTLRGLLVLPREVWFPMQDSLVHVAAAWAVLALGVAVFVSATHRTGFTKSVLGARAVAVLLLGWALLPIVVLVAVSLLGPNMYTPRYLYATTPALALVLGATLRALRSSWLQGTCLVILVLLLVPAWLGQRSLEAKAPTSLVATQVASVLAPGDGVLFVRGEGHGWTRLARYAYPAAFAGAVDVNLGTPFEESVTFFMESDVPLGQVTDRLTGVNRVVAVVPSDPTPQGLRDLQELADNGFALATTSLSGAWQVQVWLR